MRMPVIAIAAVVIAAVVIFAALSWPSSGDKDAIFQKGTLADLLEGRYDGTMKVGDLLEHGDVGLGTFHALNGEMIVIEGKCYQVTNDGVVHSVDEDMLTPFATVTFFHEDYVHTVDAGLNYSQLQADLFGVIDDDIFVVFIMPMTFDSIRVRSVPASEKPYQPLMDMIANQTVFDLTDVRGTMIGIYSPSYIGQIDSAGFHFHFISDDRTSGGHVLDLMTGQGEVEIDEKSEMELNLN